MKRVKEIILQVYNFKWGFPTSGIKAQRSSFISRPSLFSLSVLLAHAGNLERDHGKERESERAREEGQE